MTFELYPNLPLLVALLLMPAVSERGRRVLTVLAPTVSLVCLVSAPLGTQFSFLLAQHDWVYWHHDALSRVFAFAFIAYALLSGVYAWTESGLGPKMASMAVVAGGLGVVLAGDLLTLYFFWEMLTVGSVFTIWFGRTPTSYKAGLHYAMLHLFGSACLLIGILLFLNGGGQGMPVLSPQTPYGWLILLGFVVSAAVPPLHAWLSDAYPRASIYGTVFLAAYATKSAVYILARMYPGTDLLVWAGAAMALYGVFFAVLENNIRRLLAYHIISQVGFMVCGVGIGTALAVNGAAAHAFCHIFYKGLLMMSAGAVVHSTGRTRLTELGGLGKPLFWTFLFCAVGAFSISGVPLLNGFISKSLVISAAAEAHWGAPELMLIAASMGTFLSIGLKLLWFTFGAENQGARVQRDLPTSMSLAMAVSSAVCIITGVYPDILYRFLPFPVDYVPYTASHVLQTVQLLIGTCLGFYLLRSWLRPKQMVSLDVDHLYRYPVAWAVANAGKIASGFGQAVQRHALTLLLGSEARLRAIYRRWRLDTLAAQATPVWLTLVVLTLLIILLRHVLRATTTF